MCGIAGFLTTNWPGDERATAIATAMRDSVGHRGPDDTGLWLDGAAGMALGFRRLSIIDLSAEGHQPMASSCGRYVMIFNGEIYNHRELRAEIESRLPWRGHSDTEVVLGLITLQGFEAALARLTGMFAIALWDKRERCLWLARDRLGEKPLYYGRSGGSFVFGSELQALRAHPDLAEAGVDRGAASLFLRQGFVPAPLSIWRGVCKLPPGACLRVTAGGEPERHRYWDAASVLVAARRRGFAGSEDDAFEELQARLKRIVAERLIADVPVGAFLSGGIDSSTVTALMMASGHRPVRTFTVGFPGTKFDESPYAEQVARHLGCEHTTYRLGEQEALAVVPTLGLGYDEPFADPSQIATVLLCRETRRDVTVALSGDGGDELFGGYARYLDAARRWAQASGQPDPIRKMMRAINRGEATGMLARLAGRKLRKQAASLGAADADALYRDRLLRWRADEGLVETALEPESAWDDPLPAPEPALSLERRFMLRDLGVYLPDDLLVKVDRASMSFGLEVRAPLLDHGLVEFIWSLPDSMTVGDGRKGLLRRVLAGHVPPSLFERPKRGFEPPLVDWLGGPLRDWAEALLGRHGGYYDARLVRRRWDEHVSGRRHWTYSLWTVLMFEAWMQVQAAR